ARFAFLVRRRSRLLLLLAFEVAERLFLRRGRRRVRRRLRDLDDVAAERRRRRRRPGGGEGGAGDDDRVQRGRGRVRGGDVAGGDAGSRRHLGLLRRELEEERVVLQTHDAPVARREERGAPVALALLQLDVAGGEDVGDRAGLAADAQIA